MHEDRYMSTRIGYMEHVKLAIINCDEEWNNILKMINFLCHSWHLRVAAHNAIHIMCIPLWNIFIANNSVNLCSHQIQRMHDLPTKNKQHTENRKSNIVIYSNSYAKEVESRTDGTEREKARERPMSHTKNSHKNAIENQISTLVRHRPLFYGQKVTELLVWFLVRFFSRFQNSVFHSSNTPLLSNEKIPEGASFSNNCTMKFMTFYLFPLFFKCNFHRLYSSKAHANGDKDDLYGNHLQNPFLWVIFSQASMKVKKKLFM